MHSTDPPHAFFMCQTLYVLGTQCTSANKANIKSLLKLMLGSQQINKVMTIVEEEEAGKGIGAFLDGCNYM